MCSAVVCNGKGARLTQQTAVQQCRFDLAQFDAVSTDFHLEVLPSEEFHRAVLPVHAEISGIIEPLSGALVCEEPLCGQNRIVQIAHGNAGSRDVQFSDDVRRTILHVLVENAESLSGQRIAVGYAAPGRFDFRHRIIVGPDGCLGRTAQAVNSGIRKCCQKFFRQRQRNPVAAHHDHP